MRQRSAPATVCRSPTLAIFVLLCFSPRALVVAQSSPSSSGPSTLVDSYILPTAAGVQFISLLTVGDGTAVPKTQGDVSSGSASNVTGKTTRLVGKPDGIVAVDGPELLNDEPDANEYFFLLINHELKSDAGIIRDHGSIGAFVSKWKIRKDTFEVVEGDDLVKKYFDWDEASRSYIAATTVFDSLCSADRPPPYAIYNPATGLGSKEIVHFTGEEVNEGRALGIVVSGDLAGTAYGLEHMGFARWENVLLSAYPQDATVAIGLDDGSDGEVYVYAGMKSSMGTEVEKAGMVGGKLYALAVVGKPYELADPGNATRDITTEERFVLKLIGKEGNRPRNGQEMTVRGKDTVAPLDPTQNFESLKMGWPEDGAWDNRPGFQNIFYFVTSGGFSNNQRTNTRLWRLAFDDMTDVAKGGNMTILLEGPDFNLASLDNVAFEVLNGRAKLYIQEDPGSDPRLGKIWEYSVESGMLQEMAHFDPQLFLQGGGPDFLTEDEESSGIVSLKNILGEGYFAVSAQAHSGAGIVDAAELFEHGQISIMKIHSNGTESAPGIVVPSDAPSRLPSMEHSGVPSVAPTSVLTMDDDAGSLNLNQATGAPSPTPMPSIDHSNAPSVAQTSEPSIDDSAGSLNLPTSNPSKSPSFAPSRKPSIDHSSVPTVVPTNGPMIEDDTRSSNPTASSPTVMMPSRLPNIDHSSMPSVAPTPSEPTFDNYAAPDPTSPSSSSQMIRSCCCLGLGRGAFLVSALLRWLLNI
mmetsp:Transcript_40732/g.85569  ORF Transcript_40732/g.85569 Transcript_40732/m.85569 type:complete len:749 (+) Transcript_40732:82-2328(+)